VNATIRRSAESIGSAFSVGRDRFGVAAGVAASTAPSGDGNARRRTKTHSAIAVSPTGGSERMTATTSTAATRGRRRRGASNSPGNRTCRRGSRTRAARTAPRSQRELTAGRGAPHLLGGDERRHTGVIDAGEPEHEEAEGGEGDTSVRRRRRRPGDDEEQDRARDRLDEQDPADSGLWVPGR